MPLYETVFIARQDVPSTQVETLANTFADIVAGLGGQVSKKEYWGLRNLTYRIKKNRKGHYMLMNIEAPAAAVLEMERNMTISEDVVRFLTVRVDALEAGPSQIMQNKGEREGREGRGDRGERGFGRRDRGDRGDRGERGERPRFGGGAPAPSETPAAGEG